MERSQVPPTPFVARFPFECQTLNLNPISNVISDLLTSQPNCTIQWLGSKNKCSHQWCWSCPSTRGPP